MSTNRDNVGHTDRVEDYKEAKDLLGVVNYYNAVARFLTSCETPMTLSVQGDWGSGKTTAIKLIIQEIEKINDEINKESLSADNSKTDVKKYIPIEFNTWKYSQYGADEKLIESLLSDLTRKMGAKDTSGRIGQHLSAIRTGIMAKDLVKKFGSHVFGAYIEQAANGNGELGGLANKFVSEVMEKIGIAGKDLESDKSRLEDEIKDFFKNSGKKSEKKEKIEDEKDVNGRFIIFIDDLDRLRPEVAVELLEAIKVFLDIKYCVFVLAMDEEVVMQGIKNKYKDSLNEEQLKEKGRNFFDKIIQVPFDLPTEYYEISTYVTDLFFGKSDVEDEGVKTEIDKYVYALKCYGIYNPRMIKRLCNQMELHKKILNYERTVEIDEKERNYFLLVYLIVKELDKNRDAIKYNRYLLEICEYLDNNQNSTIDSSVRLSDYIDSDSKNTISNEEKQEIDRLIKTIGITGSKPQDKIRRYCRAVSALGKKVMKYTSLKRAIENKGIVFRPKSETEIELKYEDKLIAKITSYYCETQYNVVIYKQEEKAVNEEVNAIEDGNVYLIEDDNIAEKIINKQINVDVEYPKEYIYVNKRKKKASDEELQFVTFKEPSKEVVEKLILRWIDYCIYLYGNEDSDEETEINS